MSTPDRESRLRFIPFQLPTAVSKPPSGERWIHEVKFDGYRTEIVISDGKARAYTKNGNDWTRKYSPVIAAAENLACRSAILDGEMVVNDSRGASDFNELIRAIGRSPDRLAFVAFDILHLDDVDLRDCPLVERKALLRELLPQDEPRLQYSEHFEEEGPLFFKACDGMGLEGIVSKRAESRYRSGPSKNWLKTKCYVQGEFDVIGIERTAKGESVALLASRENGSYAGAAFVTLKRVDRERFWRRVHSLQTEAVPMASLRKKEAQWVRPGIVAQVKHLKGERGLRHASLTGILTDED